MFFESACRYSINVHQLTFATTSLRTLPRNFQEKDRHLFQQFLQYDGEASHLLELENVTAYSDGWLYKDYTLLKESFTHVRYPSPYRRLKALAKRAIHRPNAMKIEGGVWITDNWSRNYYHWLTDAIPKLYLATRGRPDLEILLPAMYDTISYAKESLQPMGLGAVRIIGQGQGALIRKLLLPTRVADTGNYNEDVIREVGDLYRRYYGISQPKGRRIYVSRSKAPVRNVLNETEIKPILSRFGFEIVHCENLSFSEQVKLFSDSAIVAGPHGAGFVNTMFMPEGSKVLEIHPADTKINNCYFTMASAFHHSYFYMLANTASSTLPSHLDNMIVDPAKLQEQLEAVCRD